MANDGTGTDAVIATIDGIVNQKSPHPPLEKPAREGLTPAQREAHTQERHSAGIECNSLLVLITKTDEDGWRVSVDTTNLLQRETEAQKTRGSKRTIPLIGKQEKFSFRNGRTDEQIDVDAAKDVSDYATYFLTQLYDKVTKDPITANQLGLDFGSAKRTAPLIKKNGSFSVRLKLDEVAHAHQEGASQNALRFLESAIRKLTPEECKSFEGWKNDNSRGEYSLLFRPQR